MGNCLFGGLGNMEEYLFIKVIKLDSGVLEFFFFIVVGFNELKIFVGNCYVRFNSEFLLMIILYGMFLDYNYRVLKRLYINVFLRKI